MAEERKVVEYKARDGSDIKLTIEICQKYLVSGKAELCTQQEFMFFMASCKAKGMNPFIKDCYLVKYSSDPAAIITSIEFYRKRAKAQDDCQGWKNGIILKNETGVIEYRDGSFIMEGEKLLGAWFECLPKGWIEPMKWTVSLKPYIKKTKEGNTTQFWSEDKQPGQIAKIAEAQGLRKIWSGEFEHMYVDAEMRSRDAQEELNNALNVTPEEDPAVLHAFDTLFMKGKPDLDAAVLAFVSASAKGNGTSEYEIKKAANVDPDGFKKAFDAWQKKQKPAPEKKSKKAKVDFQAEQPEPEPEPEPEQTYPSTVEDLEDLEKVAADESPLKPWNDKDVLYCHPAKRQVLVGVCITDKCDQNEKCEAYGNYCNEHLPR